NMKCIVYTLEKRLPKFEFLTGRNSLMIQWNRGQEKVIMIFHIRRNQTVNHAPDVHPHTKLTMTVQTIIVTDSRHIILQQISNSIRFEISDNFLQDAAYQIINFISSTDVIQLWNGRLSGDFQ